MAHLRVYVEIGGDGGCLFYTFDPPGLLARGASFEEALAAAPAEAARLRRFLAGGNLPGAAGNPPGAGGSLLGLLEEPWDDGDVPEFVMAETIWARYQVANGRTNATFEPDLIPVLRSEVPGFLAVLACIRTRLLALKDRIPPEAYAYRSLPRRKTIEEQLRHMADCDYWYLTRLWDGLPHLPRARDAWHKLDLNRRRALDKLENLSDAELALQRRKDREVWTTRKVFRRFPYHEKFHVDTVERDLGLFSAERGLRLG